MGGLVEALGVAAVGVAVEGALAVAAPQGVGDMLPKWAEKHLGKNQLELVREAVVEAEKKTSGEIIPMVVQQSARTGYVLVILVLISALVLAALAYEIPQLMTWPWLVAEVFTGGVISWWLSGLDMMKRLLTSKEDLAAQVDMRAELEFYEHGLDRTKGATGILVFVSLMEHRAVVLADRSISEKLPPETWNGVVSTLVQGVKNCQLGKGLADSVRMCADLAAPHFPRSASDINELPDKLIVKR